MDFAIGSQLPFDSFTEHHWFSGACCHRPLVTIESQGLSGVLHTVGTPGNTSDVPDEMHFWTTSLLWRETWRKGRLGRTLCHLCPRASWKPSTCQPLSFLVFLCSHFPCSPDFLKWQVIETEKAAAASPSSLSLPLTGSFDSSQAHLLRQSCRAPSCFTDKQTQPRSKLAILICN